MTFLEAITLAAVRGGRSYAWSEALIKQIERPISIENFDVSLNRIMECEARAVVKYAREICKELGE